MVRTFAFTASSLLAISGATMSVAGIFNESFQTALAGLVLIFTASVFARLYRGSRSVR